MTDEQSCFCSRRACCQLVTEDDLKVLVNFLREFSYLYESPNIRFLADKQWQRPPVEFGYTLENRFQWLQFLSGLDNEQLNQLPFAPCTANSPPSLQDFIRRSKEVSHLPVFSFCCFDNCLENEKRNDLYCSGIKAKKLHEIENFALILKEYCRRYCIKRIIDVGCGIGHLLNYLADEFEVVGVECDERLCCVGRHRYSSINYRNLKLNRESLGDTHILSFFEGTEPDRSAIVSLHGCGDLQTILLKLFTRLKKERVPLIFVVSCCYHKMSGIDEEVAAWALSDCVRKISPSGWRLRRSGLRLGSQKQICSWVCGRELRSFHERNFLTRALLECVNDVTGIISPSSPRQLSRSLGSIDNIISIIAGRMNISKELSLELENASMFYMFLLCLIGPEILLINFINWRLLGLPAATVTNSNANRIANPMGSSILLNRVRL
ncbi:unnamed protein product [Enterobius vermicularis]|uniref:Methyltranfer_dom domain-containing protein n=1 Tax=Enterobius vermicularis TaxID=51028 RepID=A0A0N4V395_ENTVE|nr:unnamed protein product [Enterobius vermicularis]